MDLKRLAAEGALELLKGRALRVLGLGTGSTAELVIEGIASLYSSGELEGTLAVPTSERTAKLAQSLGIPLTTLEEHPEVDLTIDGADEVDPKLNLIKGLGGALTREKIIASASKEYIIVVDESKRVKRLGTRAPLPVEVLRFGWKLVERELTKLGCEPKLRTIAGEPFITDEGNYILDCRFPNGIRDPYTLSRALSEIPGLVEHGLFLDLADRVIIASTSGVEVLER
jgi:ribose 5-phosphate isomerase A